MALQLYNTLTRKTEPLAPVIPGKIGLYCCGPTVYDVPHAGHARVYSVFDVLVRALRRRGLEVTYVRNVTDVDDKILNRARENGETPLDLSRRMTAAFHEDMSAIGNLPPTAEPRVSETLPEIIALISQILARGSAYVADMPGGTRDVYFSVRGFPGYGKLSRRKLDDLLAGARVEADATHKQDPMDFALWKGADRSEWGWESPWGWGRPGWHIECSAMSHKFLGHGFDIHAGGMDLIFPHHENEIAQSEAAHPGGGDLARCWVHNGFVNVDKEKMSKSLGNFVTVRDVLARNDAEGLRLFLLGVHYRGPIQFDTETTPEGRVVFPGVDEAERRVDYLYATRERLAEVGLPGVTVPARLPKELVGIRESAEKAMARADAAIEDDLNTSVAIAELGELAKLGNELCDLALRRRKDNSFQGAAGLAASIVGRAMDGILQQLGLLQTPCAGYRARTRARRLSLRGLTEGEVEARVNERFAARREKAFDRADALRVELTSQGIAVHDGTDGSTWTIDV